MGYCVAVFTPFQCRKMSVLHAGLAAAHICCLDREAGLGRAVMGRGPGGRIGQDLVAWGWRGREGQERKFTTHLQITQILNQWRRFLFCFMSYVFFGKCTNSIWQHNYCF